VQQRSTSFIRSDDDGAATAILDRFLAHATIVPVTGKSYRLRQRASTTDD